MRILSNDYPANVPGSKKMAHGGPAVFAKGFSTYACSLGHDWMGLIIGSTLGKTNSSRLTQLKGSGKKSYLKLMVPYKKIKAISNAKDGIDPEKLLSREIEKIAELIEKRGIDVVFINGYSLFVWILLKAAEKAGVPVAIQHAGIFSKELDIHKHKFTPEGIAIMKEMERDSSTLSAIEIFISEWSRDYYTKNVYSNNDKPSLIIPLPFVFPPIRQRKKAANDKIEIGIVARWDRIKNHEAVLALAEEIEKQNLDWRVNSVTGIPDTKINKEFKDRYRELVKVLPSMDRQEIFDFMNSMDMMILPSIFDVSPFVVIESIVCGTPIIISSTNGYAPIFKKYGAKEYIADFGKPSKVLDKIKKLKDKKMPPGLIRHLHARHNPEKVFRSYINLFKTLTK